MQGQLRKFKVGKALHSLLWKWAKEAKFSSIKNILTIDMARQIQGIHLLSSAASPGETKSRTFVACVSTVILTVLTLCATTHGAEQKKMSAGEAYNLLRSGGKLSSVKVTEAFDFAVLGDTPQGSPFPETIYLHDVQFEGPVRLVGDVFNGSLRIEQSQFKDNVLFEDCTLRTLVLRSSVLSAPFVMRDCEIQGISRLDDNKYGSDAKFHTVRFLRRPSFGNSIFHGRAEFLNSEFGVNDPHRKATSFSDVAFQGPALFNNAIFHNAVRFQASVFEQDASFLNVRVVSEASFRSVHFKGDAEFRFCDITDADYGDRDNLTLFAARADFRGCKFGSARFEFTEFRGETSFVNAAVGPGGATFSNASLGNAFTDFSGLNCDGPLVLSDAYFPSLRFYWYDLGSALLAAEPDVKVLAALQKRLEAVGDTSGALEVTYHLARQRFIQNVSAELQSASNGKWDFLDKVSRRLILYGECLVWGWPTGYGTKLGRIALIALVSWLLFALPIALAGRQLARITQPVSDGSKEKSDAIRNIYEPISSNGRSQGEQAPRFPASPFARLYLALGFTFRLLFKVGPRDISHIPENAGSNVRWRAYFSFLWYFGAYLLVLLTLTLANSSPMISRIIGELAP